MLIKMKYAVASVVLAFSSTVANGSERVPLINFSACEQELLLPSSASELAEHIVGRLDNTPKSKNDLESRQKIIELSRVIAERVTEIASDHHVPEKEIIAALLLNPQSRPTYIHDEFEALNEIYMACALGVSLATLRNGIQTIIDKSGHVIAADHINGDEASRPLTAEEASYLYMVSRAGSERPLENVIADFVSHKFEGSPEEVIETLRQQYTEN